MQYFTDSPHKISDETRLTFSELAYSKFKFGASDIGRKFGAELYPVMESFLQQNQSKWDKIIVYSSPYDYIPTATYTMAFRFFEMLRKSPNLSGKTILWQKIKRTTTYTIDYGNLNAEERLQLIGKDSFELEHVPPPDALLIFIDDIKITGSHEYVIKRMIEKYRLPNDACFLYYAILDNKCICPTFENRLNYAYINSPQRVRELLCRSDFQFNTRVVKYILASPKADFREILSGMDEYQKGAFCQLAEGNGYSGIKAYADNFQMLVEGIGVGEKGML
jgi:hypothetical protein